MNRKALLIAAAAGLAPLSLALAQVAAPTAPAAAPDMPNGVANITTLTPADLLKPAGAEWLNYNGDVSGDRYSRLTQINRANAGKLELAWTSQVSAPAAGAGFAGAGGRGGAAGRGGAPGAAGPGGGGRGGAPGGFGGRGAPAAPAVPGTPEGGSWALNSGIPASFGAEAVSVTLPNTGQGGVRSTPLMRNGVLFYTVGTNAYAVDGRTGKQIWHYVADSSSGLSNRGLAMAGDRLFMMANGGITALDAKTGAEIWRKSTETPVPATAPVVVKNLVIYGVGNDNAPGSRSWLEARDINTGEIAWKWDATPHAADPEVATWPSADAADHGAGTPWGPAVYDPKLNLIYVGTGNPTPTKDRRRREGDDLWTGCIVAINPDTGKLVWYFQMTPGDDHDYDGNQSLVQFDATINGKPRKLIGMIGRQGYMYVVDRTNGKHVYTRKALETANFALPTPRPNAVLEPDPRKSPSRGGSLVSPSSEGATNYPAASYSPQTGLIYSSVIQSWSEFYTGGSETWLGSFKTSVRAYNAKTGALVWRHDYREPYGIQARYPGITSTAGGLLFTGDVSGNAVAYDAGTGKILWHAELNNAVVTNGPITYMLDGKQYVVFGARDNLVAYKLP